MMGLTMENLAWNGERNHLAMARVVKAEEAVDLTRADITAPLRHHTNPSLWVWGLERVDVMHKRWLWRDLKVTNHTITLEHMKALTS